MEVKRTPNRYVILLSATIVGMLTGTSLVYSIFRDPLMAANGWSASQVTLAYSLFMLTVLAGTFLSGPVQRRFKPSIIIFFAGILQGVGFFLTGFAKSIPMLYIFYSLFGGAGNGFLYGTAVGVVTRWFPDKKGFANGMCVGAMALSPMIFAPLGNALIERMSVFRSFNVMGIIMIVLFGIVAWFLQDPPKGWRPEGWEATSSVKSTVSSKNYSLKEMFATPLYWALLVFFFCSILPGVMMTGQASVIAQQQASLTAAEGALMTGFLAVFSCLGRMVLATLSDKTGRYNMLIAVTGITVADLLLFFNSANTFATFMVALFFVACSNGAMMAMLPALVSDAFGQEDFSVRYPFIYCGYTLSSFVGPLLASSNFERNGNYTGAVLTAGAVAAVGFIGMFVCKYLASKQRKKEQSEIY